MIAIFVFTNNVKAEEFSTYFYDLNCSQIEIHSDELESLGGSPRGHISTATYLKFWIPERIPAAFVKCLYIDCDTYLNGDILEILEIDFKLPLAAVGKNRNYPDTFEESNYGYFNAGLMIFNLKDFDKLKFKVKIKEVMASSQEFPFQDQDVLNIVFRDNWFHLPEVYNYYPWDYMNLQKSSIQDIKLIHFIGPIKPWTRDTPYSGWWKEWQNEYLMLNPNGLHKSWRNSRLYQQVVQANLYKIMRSKLLLFIPKRLIRLLGRV